MPLGTRLNSVTHWLHDPTHTPNCPIRHLHRPPALTTRTTIHPRTSRHLTKPDGPRPTCQRHSHPTVGNRSTRIQLANHWAVRRTARSTIRTQHWRRPMRTTSVITNGKPHDAQLLLTVAQAAAALNISRTRLFELFRNGQLPSVKLGRVTRVRVSDLECFVSSLTAQSR